MVMEAATLSGPQRKFNVVPVQKSLSLPSYARAGGEGIDHRLIFAALEQKEKVRRKSKIFTREKTARQNIFCLPISKGSKCRETSLSSDTSCSSLEYQKPKPVSKSKKEESKPATKPIENDSVESKAAKPVSECLRKENSKQLFNGSSEQNNLPLKTGYRSPVDTIRLNVGSSDSMDRSSRSSNDSLTRKERLVAIKARVEAEREKYGNSSSSEEESRSNITRYNSDGVIHRTVREVKSRSYRHEKRLRRRSQGEWATKKIERKNNLSLCLNPDDGGIKLHLEKLDRLNSEINNLEIKTDYCPSPNFPDMTKKSYFSDFPNKEKAAKFVQQRIRHIEEEERKRRSGSDFFEKLKSPFLSSKAFQEKPTSASTEHINWRENKSVPSSCPSDLRSPSTDNVRRPSPIPKSPQPPTPPPRSPKSITFVNKVFLQHQNSTLLKQENSLDRKNYFQPNITAASTKPFDKLSLRTESRDSLLLQSNSAEKQQMRDILNSRRKTCGNFDFVDEKLLADLSSSLENVGSNSSKNSLLKKPANDTDNRNVESPLFRISVNKSKLDVNKWEECERRRDFMFNSLENRKRVPCLRKQTPLENTDSCLCFLKSGNKKVCNCKSFDNPCDNKIFQSDNILTTEIGQTFSPKPYLISNEQYLRKLKTPSLKTDSCVCQTSFENKTACQCKSAKIEETNYQCYGFQNNFNKALEEKSGNKKEFSYQNTTKHEKEDILFKQISTYQNPFDEKKDSFDFNSSKEDVKCFSNSTSATANLDSAMAELESVYMSLKFSSDNLSDRNSLSALSEEDSKVSKNNKDIFCEKEQQLHKTSADESGSYVSNLNISDIFIDSRLFSDPSHSSTVEKDKNVHQPTKSSNQFYKDLSINELFKDLTPELDALEDKIDSSIDKLAGDCQRGSNFNTKPNLSSSICFKKEFYENLNKQQEAFQKKKMKAKRSLSENISKLMNNTAADSISSISKNPSASSFQSSLLTSESNLSCNGTSFDQRKVLPKQKMYSSSFRSVNRTNDSVSALDPTHDEIRHIRVSMDSSVSTPANTNVDSNQYSRLSSVVHSPQISPKCEATKPFQFASGSNSKENIDRTIDGLEELLNSLLVEVPEGKQSSPPTTKDAVASTPPSPISTGSRENVRANSCYFHSKMDMCVTSKPKNEVSNTESRLRTVKSEDKAQKENTDLHQNNNAHLNQMSFIPVYTNKSDMCHYFSDKNDESKAKSIDRDQLSHPISPRPRCLVDQNEKFSLRSVRAHIRRRSVGFEDMTSLNSTNDRRSEALSMNSNLTPGSDKACSKIINSDNDIKCGFGRRNQRENNIHISSLNQNSKVVKNANDQMQNLGKPYHQYKDKSSKRKSSLNRMDFVDFPPSYTGNTSSKNLSYRSKNSSSDEEIDAKQQFLSCSSKRKHNVSPGAGSESAQKTFNKALYPNNSPINKQKLLPKSSQNTHFKLKQHRRAQSVTMQLQKLSHSAGELESLTDDANGTNKMCLSAQEFETRDPSLVSTSLKTGIRSNLKKFSSLLPPLKRSGSPMKNSNQDTSQQKNAYLHQNDFQSSVGAVVNNAAEDTCAQTNILCSKSAEDSCENTLSKSCVMEMDDPVLTHLNLNDSFDLKHIDSRSEDEVDTTESIAKLQTLSISEEKGFESSARNSDENCDSTCSDGEKRPNSILRKKYNEERKELHSILKPPPEDKQSKTPTSILKHRESSEEKDVWQLSDLHSILKKSTSEDDSCNSGPDIRPILKVSTDEESPVGTARPRPILKKRTSFSEECSFASYPNGELKPILKKKTPLSNEDQPRPILKSRRKSDDARSTLSEFVASRPRAYSADMGIKSNHENKQEGFEQKTEDFCKLENSPL